MPHILHIIDALALGGMERMLVEIANASVSEGMRVSVCVTRSQVTLAHRLDPRIELLVLGRRHTTELLPLVRLSRWIRRNRVDVLHCHGRPSFSLAALLSTLHAVEPPIVFHEHHGRVAGSAVPTWFRWARRRISAFVGVYDSALEWARSAGVPEARLHVIQNALDLASLARQTVTGESLRSTTAPRIVCVGGLRHEKAVDVLLEAMALVRTPAVLHVIGGDADRAYAAACRARAGRSDLANRVVFLGAREDALALAATADLAVHSSRVESGPLVLAEYAALGVPFVATRVGGIANELEAANVGHFVEPDDPAALANEIESLLSMSADNRREIGRRAREVAWSRFDISAAMPRWRELYASVRR